MAASSVPEILRKQREFFATGKTLDAEFRKGQLRRLAEAVHSHEREILDALKADLAKPEMEAFVGEVAFLYDEIKFSLKRLNRWMKPRKVPTPLIQFRASSWIHSEPLGVVLIIGPWNYPFQLVIAPLVAAISAGNCSVLKPSELAPATSKVVAKMVTAVFDPAFVAVAEGGVETSTALLAEKFDYIFFTGGTGVGKVVAQAAAKHLTPYTLELGGKSPCIVDESADIETSARRIVWGKFFNSGQTCVAPDYLLVPESKKEALLAAMKKNVETFFGKDPEKSPDYGRIINDRHFQRLSKFLTEGKAVIGGKANDKSRFIAPTVLDGIKAEDSVMQDEIFGPVLPVITYKTLDETIKFVKERPKPLALYFFSSDKANQERILRELSFGGGCVNDTLMHLGNPHLPFGGVGDSGNGAYHGKFGFETFSHRKSVVRRRIFPDPSLRYPPYAGRLGIIRKILG